MSYMRGLLVAFALIFVTATIATPALAQNGIGAGGFNPTVSGDRGDPAKDYKTGVAAIQKNDYPAAEAAFAKVLQSVPRDSDTLFLYGYALAAQNKLVDAEAAYAKAIKYDPDHVQALGEHAITSIQLKKRDDAAADLQKLKVLDADCAGKCEHAEDLKEYIPLLDKALGTPAKP